MREGWSSQGGFMAFDGWTMEKWSNVCKAIYSFEIDIGNETFVCAEIDENVWNLFRTNGNRNPVRKRRFQFPGNRCKCENFHFECMREWKIERGESRNRHLSPAHLRANLADPISRLGIFPLSGKTVRFLTSAFCFSVNINIHPPISISAKSTEARTEIY